MGTGFSIPKVKTTCKHSCIVRNDYITGGLILKAISLSLGECRGLELSDISWHSSIALVYLILIVTVVCFTDFYWLLRVTTPSLANTFAYVSRVIAVILGWALLHESITSTTVTAMIVIKSTDMPQSDTANR